MVPFPPSSSILRVLSVFTALSAPSLAQLAGVLRDIGPNASISPALFIDARGISDDGLVVVGDSPNASISTNSAFRWGPQSGLAYLGVCSCLGSGARAVTPDGQTIVGGWSSPTPGFRWRSNGNVDVLSGPATCVSADGAVVGGARYVANVGAVAYRWTEATGSQDLSAIFGAPSSVVGISADGAVLASEELVYDSSSGAVQALPTLGGPTVRAAAISGDGLVVVGNSSLNAGSALPVHAFLWTAAGGMQDLGTLGGLDSFATAVSADGTVVVGYAKTAGDQTHAFRWTAAGGMQDLGALGGGFSQAFGVSSDGSLVVGSSTRATGQTSGFVFGLDCDANLELDIYDIAADPVSDCNGNGLLDSCDVGSGASADTNLNGRPDECECLSGVAPTTYCTAKISSGLCSPSVLITSAPSATNSGACVIYASHVDVNRNGLMFYGYQPAATPFQNGVLCVQPPLRRTGIQNSGSGDPLDNCGGSFDFDFNAFIATGADPLLQVVGQSFACQFWARDPLDAFGSSFSNAVQGQICN